MKKLSEYIKEAEEKKKAIGHFNVSNLEIFHGILEAGKRFSKEQGEKIPLIIGLSEGEANFFGHREARALVDLVKKETDYPIFLNADHHYSLEKVKEAMEAGFDAVIFDAVKLPFEENIALTKKCVEAAKEKSLTENREILVEAELGFIGKSSKLLDQLPQGVGPETLTKPEEAKYFVEKTGINLLAPSVGNVHGMVKGGNPKLEPNRIREIKEATGIPLVLHGGSGISENDFQEAIKAGINIVHINTEIRVAYRKALEKSLAENPNEVAPYKFLPEAKKAVAEVVYKYLLLFNR